MIKCEKCIHKEVCSWKELVKTLYTDYEKMVEENTSTYSSSCPVRYINDPFKCNYFGEPLANTENSIPAEEEHCDTCKYWFKDSKAEPCINCKNNYTFKWEPKEDKDGK